MLPTKMPIVNGNVAIHNEAFDVLIGMKYEPHKIPAPIAPSTPIERSRRLWIMSPRSFTKTINSTPMMITATETINPTSLAGPVLRNSSKSTAPQNRLTMMLSGDQMPEARAIPRLCVAVNAHRPLTAQMSLSTNGGQNTSSVNTV